MHQSLFIKAVALATFLHAGLFSSEVSADECVGLDQYRPGTPYTQDQRIKNIDETGKLNRYECDIPGWCSLDAAWAYEPGKGIAWESAWHYLGACTDGDPSNLPPIAQANGPYAGASGELLNFSSAGSHDPDGNISNFLWDFGDGTQSRQANPSHAYENNGQFTVTLTITDNDAANTVATTFASISSADPGGSPNPQPIPGGGYSMTRQNIESVEAALTSSPLYAQVKDTIATRPNSVVESVFPRFNSNPDNVKRVESILSEDGWEFLFPMRNASYSYTRFLRAVAKFPALCKTYTDGRNSDAICRKSLATMFAHFAQETGAHNPSSSVEEWRQGLYFLRESGCTESGPYCGYNAECYPGSWQAEAWPCGLNPDNSFKKYFGRGAKQLSYNYNYGPFSQAMFGDVGVLLNAPDRVADTWLNLASAVFFFTYPQPPKPSMLHVIDGTWTPNSHDLSLGLTPGFGVTTQIINGGIECGKGAETRQSQNRIEYYRAQASALGVPIPNDEVLGCANMRKFDAYGSGAMLIYWEQDWAYYPDRPEGLSFACKLVSYQTQHSALLPGDYEKCVVKHFDVQVLP